LLELFAMDIAGVGILEIYGLNWARKCDGRMEAIVNPHVAQNYGKLL
jgi:hypothetical protein